MEFAATHWSGRPLLSRRAELPADFADLLSADAVDELLSRRGLRTPFLRVAKEGQVVADSRFTGPGGAGAAVADQVRDDRVLELFLDGSTLVLQGLHRLWPPLVAFGAALSRDLGHPVQVNAYVTPPSNRGFSAHYDVHDVFVLQVAGEKRWVVHPPPYPQPLRSQPWTDRADAVAAATSEPPLLETVLCPGDALYLPRGFIHAAQALGGTTIHLTVGVHPITRYDVAGALLELAADDEALRGSLPLGVDLTDTAGLAAEVAAGVAALRARAAASDPEEVAARLRQRIWPATRPGPIAPLRQAAAVGAVGPGTVIQLRAGLWAALHTGPDRVTLELTGRRLTLPAGTAAAVERLLVGTALPVGALPGLDPDDAVVLARRLLREAVVVAVAG